MKNLISVNARGVNKNFLDKVFEHNVSRLKKGDKIDYLLSNENSLGSRSFFYEFEKTLKIAKQKQLKEEDYFLVSSQLEKMEKIRVDKLQQRENKGDYLKNHLCEMIVALSQEQVEEYLKEGKDLSLGIEEFAKNLEEKYNFKILFSSEHFDEGYVKDNEINRNYHFHIVAYNYDLENMKAITSSFSRQDFRDLQDLASNSFKNVGLDFERGISKTITKKQHLEKNEHIIQKQKEEIKELYTNTNKLKNEFKDLRNLFEKGSEEYNNLNILVKNLQQEEKELRQKKEVIVEDFQEQRTLISSFAKDFIVNNTTKKNDIRTINNSQDFYKNLVLEIEKITKLDIKNLDYENIKVFEKNIIEENRNLTSKMQQLENKVQNLENENYSLKDKIEELENENDKIKDKNNNFKEYIIENNLKEDFKKFKEKKIQDIEIQEREI
ncbi:hypothetical protein N5U00_02060 [Aliarcobacter butzleri]|uniref:coiled-coil domain-containing protein n=1 Tax=Aliarcobacter butzleri TaxID=28197 RepID=UPI0021B57C21|nr:hypothetical protein [Aliarcobacter butzleri]MCT7574101.1 hypothetical protein [Aliarcobacter butzleri]